MSLWRSIRDLAKATGELRRHCNMSKLQPYNSSGLRSCEYFVLTSKFTAGWTHPCCLQLDYEDDEEDEDGESAESEEDESDEADDDSDTLKDKEDGDEEKDDEFVDALDKFHIEDGPKAGLVQA